MRPTTLDFLYDYCWKIWGYTHPMKKGTQNVRKTRSTFPTSYLEQSMMMVGDKTSG